MNGVVSVAVPVLNGGPRLNEVLRAVREQEVDREIELLVADSGSTDGSRELASWFGATVIAVDRFSHGGTRNELVRRAGGTHIAFLTQDALPADDRWLAKLLSGFDYGEDVGLVYGPYRPRADAPVAIRRELDAWFSSLAPEGVPRVDRTRTPEGPGPETFFTDANAAIARVAWERVPFRDVAYAEDQALALDMMRAGFAKVFVPSAGVEHSHTYSPLRQFRRSFDEWRALREIHDFVQPFAPVSSALSIQRDVRDDLEVLRREQAPASVVARELARSTRHWTVRTLGAALGSRADRLPPPIRRWCSLERRADVASDRRA